VHSSDTAEKWEYNWAVRQLFIDYKTAYDSLGRHETYSILTEFHVPMKLVRPIKMCLNETYNKVDIGKNLSEVFPIQNSLEKKEKRYSHGLSTLL
jgi:hypothetical protein